MYCLLFKECLRKFEINPPVNLYFLLDYQLVKVQI